MICAGNVFLDGSSKAPLGPPPGDSAPAEKSAEAALKAVASMPDPTSFIENTAWFKSKASDPALQGKIRKSFLKNYGSLEVMHGPNFSNCEGNLSTALEKTMFEFEPGLVEAPKAPESGKVWTPPKIFGDPSSAPEKIFMDPADFFQDAAADFEPKDRARLWTEFNRVLINSELHAKTDGTIYEGNLDMAFEDALDGYFGHAEGTSSLTHGDVISTSITLEGGKLTVEIDPILYDMAKELGIEAKKIPELVAKSMESETKEKFSRMIEEGLTVENIDKWLEGDRGQEWLAKNGTKMKSMLVERVKQGAPGIVMGFLGYLGADELADVVGISAIHNPFEHFMFIVGSMHGMMAAGNLAAPHAAKGLQSLGERFFKQEVMAGGKTIATSVKMATPFGKALFTGIARNIAGMSAGEIAKATAVGAGKATWGLVKMPIAAAYGMGAGVLATKIVMGTIGSIEDKLGTKMDADWKGTISLLSFFAPEVLGMITGKTGSRLASALRLGRFAKLAAYGIIADLGMTLMTNIGWGDEKAWRGSIDARLADRYFNQIEGYETASAIDDMHPSYRWAATAGLGMLHLARNVAEFFFPENMALARASYAVENGYGHMYDAIVEEDYESSKATQEALPLAALKVLANGMDGLRDKAEFYKDLSLDFLEEEIELDGYAEEFAEDMAALQSKENYAAWSPEKRAAEEQKLFDEVPEDQRTVVGIDYAAYTLQQMVKSLDFIHLDINAPYREAVDEDGAIEDGKGDAFLTTVFEGAPADELKLAILVQRQESLIIRTITEKDEGKRTELAALAKDVGLMDESGGWAFTEAYMGAAEKLKELAKSEESGDVTGAVKAHVAALKNEFMDAHDIGRKNEIQFQLMLLGETPTMAAAGVTS